MTSSLRGPSIPTGPDRTGPEGVLRELHVLEERGPGSDPADRAVSRSGADEGGRSQASRLVSLARESYRLVLGEDGRCYAVDVDGPAVAVPLRGRDGLRSRLARSYYARTPPPQRPRSSTP